MIMHVQLDWIEFLVAEKNMFLYVLKLKLCYRLNADFMVFQLTNKTTILSTDI
jgi:hypothetical protein